MGNNDVKTSGTGEVQVFELTMDNPEDQDELNRRLRKPGESDHGASANGVGADAETTTELPKSDRR